MTSVDNTILCEVARCEAAAVAKYVLGLRGTGDKQAANVGNVFHTALEVHFQGGDRDEVIARLVEEHAKYFSGQTMPEENRFALENCIKIMERFIKVRPVERWPFEVIETEKTVGIELAPGITFWVKRDMLVRDRQSGLYSPLDHKTTRTISEWWSKKYRMTSQMSGYVWATKQQYSQQAANECYVNAIELQEVPNSARKCKSHGVNYSECGVEHIKFETLIFSRQEEMLEAWQKNAIMLAKKFGILKQAYSVVELLPLAPRLGAFSDGCTFCELVKWCAVGFRKEMMSELVVYDPWEPWAEVAQAKA